MVIAPQRKRILVMLGARMIFYKRAGLWQFPLFAPNQTNSGTALPGEVSGGASRMRAIQAEYLTMRRSKIARQLLVLVTGGKEPDGHSRAEEASHQLITRYGLPRDSVVSIGGVGSTKGNAAATVEYVRKNRRRVGEVRNLSIVTNDYHMLRAWLTFSIGISEVLTGRDVSVRATDQQRIARLLNDGLPNGPSWSAAAIGRTRARVMKLLAPVFQDLTIAIEPIVVEDALLAQRDSLACRKYACLLRRNHWVRETLAFEYKGVMDLLNSASGAK
jgi:hypothetical protein